MKKQKCWMAKQMWQQVFLATSLMLAAFAVQAQVAIEAVSGSIQGGVEVVKIDLTQPLAAVSWHFERHGSLHYRSQPRKFEVN
jgi:type IV pilus assembly protein PilQ